MGSHAFRLVSCQAGCGIQDRTQFVTFGQVPVFGGDPTDQLLQLIATGQLVFVHGGGWVRGDERAGLFVTQPITYAAKGDVCISVNYRLSADKLPCIEDVKCAVRWFRAHAEKYNVDPDRIGAYGNLAGAHLVTMLGISHTDKRLDGDGPCQDYSSAVQAVAASATAPGLLDERNFDVELIQPMTYVTADAPPLLLFHEETDRTVPVSNADDFDKAMNEAGAEDISLYAPFGGTVYRYGRH